MKRSAREGCAVDHLLTERRRTAMARALVHRGDEPLPPHRARARARRGAQVCCRRLSPGVDGVADLIMRCMAAGTFGFTAEGLDV